MFTAGKNGRAREFVYFKFKYFLHFLSKMDLVQIMLLLHVFSLVWYFGVLGSVECQAVYQDDHYFDAHAECNHRVCQCIVVIE